MPQSFEQACVIVVRWFYDGCRDMRSTSSIWHLLAQLRRLTLSREATAAPAPLAFENPPVMRLFFSAALPPDQSGFRWRGDIDGVEMNTGFSQPAAFGFWIPGHLAERVTAFEAFEFPSGSQIRLSDFGPAQGFTFGNTAGMFRATAPDFTGVLGLPNSFRALLDGA